MNIRKSLMLAGGMALTLGLAGNAVAADGGELYKSKLCGTCHGMDANSPIMPSYPKLGGQNAAYAAAQIKDIRDGKRTNGLTAAMKPMVAALTDEEIDAIAEWTAQQ